MNYRTVIAVLISFYSLAADGETVTMDEQSKATLMEQYKQELLATLSAGVGNKIDVNDPKAIKAAEAFFVIDASKAYAFMKIHGVALEFCPKQVDLRTAMEHYQNAAKEMIQLGEIYYRDGIDLQIGERGMKKSGAELTDALNEMLDNMRKEYKSASTDEITIKCREATKALNALTMFYGG